MAQIKQGRYTEMPKGFITYPIKKSDTNSMNLQNVLLTEKTEKRYMVEMGDEKINEKQVTKPLWTELQKMGIKVSMFRHKHTTGRKKLISLPVEIRKIVRGSDLEAIQIRVTGDNEDKLLENIKAIKESLSVWKIEPKSCVWSQGEWKQANEDLKMVVNHDEILKEQARLKNIVADLQDKIGSIEKPHLKKSILEDRQVMKGILH